jgi:hypothetical protein
VPLEGWGRANPLLDRLQREALRQSAVNPDTGCVEVNIIATGYSEKHKRLVGHAADQIRQEVEHRRGAFSLAKLYRDMRTLNKVGLWGHGQQHRLEDIFPCRCWTARVSTMP